MPDKLGVSLSFSLRSTHDFIARGRRVAASVLPAVYCVRFARQCRHNQQCRHDRPLENPRETASFVWCVCVCARRVQCMTSSATAMLQARIQARDVCAARHGPITDHDCTSRPPAVSRCSWTTHCLWRGHCRVLCECERAIGGYFSPLPTCGSGGTRCWSRSDSRWLGAIPQGRTWPSVSMDNQSPDCSALPCA